MKLHGSFDSDQSRQAVYEYLTDPSRMLRSFPDVQLSDVTDDSFTARSDVAVGPVHETVNVHVQILQREAGRGATYHGEGEGLGSHLKLDASFELADRSGGAGTHVEWSGEATVDGPLGALADGALDGVVQQDIQGMLQSMDRSTGANAPKAG